MLCLGGLVLQPLCAPVVPHRPALFLGLGAVALSKDHPVLLETPLLSPPGMNGVGGLLVCPAATDLFSGHGRGVEQSTDETPKDESAVARVASVEAEDELVEVGVEMRSLDRPLVSAEQPTLQERHRPVDVRMNEVGFGIGKRRGLDAVVQPASGKLIERWLVRAEVVAEDHRSGLDIVFEEIGYGQG